MRLMSHHDRNLDCGLVGFVHLKSALLTGKFIARDVPFDACVDNRYVATTIALSLRLLDV